VVGHVSTSGEALVRKTPGGLVRLRRAVRVGGPGHHQQLRLRPGTLVFDPVLPQPGSRARFPRIREMDEADLLGWLPVMDVTLDESLTERILTKAERALASYVGADSRVRFDSPAHIVRAKAEYI